MKTILLLLSIPFALSAASEYKILSRCDESAEVRGKVSKEDRIQINFSISGASTCYSVTATVDGKQVRGYIIDSGLDAVLAFNQARIKTRRDTTYAPAVPLSPPAAEIVNDPGVDAKELKKPVDAVKPVKEVPKARPSSELPG